MDQCPVCGYSGDIKNALYYADGTLKMFKCPSCLSMIHFNRNGEIVYAKTIIKGKNFGSSGLLLFGGGVILVLLGFYMGELLFFFGGSLIVIGLVALIKYIDTRSKYEIIMKRLREKGMKSEAIQQGVEEAAQERKDKRARERRREERERDSDHFMPPSD